MFKLFQIYTDLAHKDNKYPTYYMWYTKSGKLVDVYSESNEWAFDTMRPNIVNSDALVPIRISDFPNTSYRKFIEAIFHAKLN